VTDSPPQGRPIPLARPPEFVVCPLMREIRAFRYFWPGWFTKAGGLMAYSANYGNMSRTLAIYIDKILKGARPGDIPVDQPTRFVLSINLKTAKALDINVPRDLAAQAEELIE
jgi:ABC transporter substrate binding protein